MDRRTFFQRIGIGGAAAVVSGAEAKTPPGEHDGKYIGEMRTYHVGGRYATWVQWDGKDWMRVKNHKGPVVEG